MSNEGQLPMLHNLLRSMKETGVDLSLLDVYLLQTNANAARYGTKDFQSITVKKFECILKSMESGEDVLWVDNDIVWFENMIEDVQTYLGDFVMQDDMPQPCTGFFLVRNTSVSKQLLQYCIQLIRKNQLSNRFVMSEYPYNDQDAFERCMKQSSAVITLLPIDQYPNGKVYFVNKNTENAKMVHNNWCYNDKKIQRFQEYNLWNPDPSILETTKRIYIQ